MSQDIMTEINIVMNYFAYVDQCQCLASDGYSLNFAMKSMPKIEKLIREELQFEETRKLFDELNSIFFKYGHSTPLSQREN